MKISFTKEETNRLMEKMLKKQFPTHEVSGLELRYNGELDVDLEEKEEDTLSTIAGLYDKTPADSNADKVHFADPEVSCTCGEPSKPGVTHRTDGPCYSSDTAEDDIPF